MNKLMMAFLLLFSSLVFAQDDNGNLQRDPGKINCNESLKRCEYIVQNMTARNLIKRIERILFEGGTLTRDMGYIESETLKVMSFWLHDEELMKRFKGLIPILDTFESFDPTNLVQVSTDVIALTDSGYTNLEASISSVGNPTDNSSDWSFGSTGLGTMDLALAVGTKLISSVLGGSKVKTFSKKLTTVTRFVPNLSGINFAQTSNVYVSPNQTSVKEEKVGLEINGQVSIERDNNSLVKIQDYKFRYGVLVPGQDGGLDRVNVLKVESPELYFVNGISNMIVSSQTTDEEITTTFGLLNFGRNRTEKLSKMLVLTRAESISFEKIVAEMKRIRDLSLFGTFSEDQISAFPRSNVEINEVLDSIKPYAFFTPSGDRVIGFHLDNSLARATNYNKSYQVKVSGAGLKTSGVRKLETFMISGFKFDEIPLRYLDKDLLKIKLQFREILPSGKKGKRLKRTLLYNPQTNKFL